MDYTLPDMFGIEGDVAVITGATGGIGKETAIAMGSLGAKLALVSSNQTRLDRLAADLRPMDLDFMTFKADVRDKDAVKEMTSAVKEHFGKIDILINTAGTVHLAEATEFAEEEWDKVIGVNLKGTFLTCQAVGKEMLQQGKGRIVNFSSVRGIQGRAKDMAYAPSKGGVDQLTRSLAIEWAEKNINVNAVAPTFTLTDINKKLLEDEEVKNWVLSRIPKGRLCNLEDLVGAVIFLCSPAADFITGQILYVDGGWTSA